MIRRIGLMAMLALPLVTYAPTPYPCWEITYRPMFVVSTLTGMESKDSVNFNLDLLKMMGKQGWEPVTVVSIGDSTLYIYFKRRCRGGNK